MAQSLRCLEMWTRFKTTFKWMSNSMVTAGLNARQSGNHPIVVPTAVPSAASPLLHLSGRDRRSMGYTQRFKLHAVGCKRNEAARNYEIETAQGR